MLYQPSYPYPYLSDVDGTKENIFSCYINAEGGSTVVAYRLTIRENSSGNMVYDSDKISLDTPLYSNEVLNVIVPANSGIENGNDYVWSIDLYDYNSDSATPTQLPDIWITRGTIQGVIDGQVFDIVPNYLIQPTMYIRTNNELGEIELYNRETGNVTLSEPLSTMPTVGGAYNIYWDKVTSNEYFFKARTTPTLEWIDNPDGITVTSKAHTFKALYEQAEGINYKSFEFALYAENGLEIANSGVIVSGAIEYTYDGFLNKNTYGIGLTLETQNEITLTLSPAYFEIDYEIETPVLENPPMTTVSCERDSVVLTWIPLIFNTVTNEGEYSLVQNVPFDNDSSVKLENGSSIQYNVSKTILWNNTTYLFWHTDNEFFDGVIYSQNGKYIELIAVSAQPPLEFTQGDLYYNTLDNLVYVAIDDDNWSIVGNEPVNTSLYHVQSTDTSYYYDNGILSATDYELPYYRISYVNESGDFKYEISNLDVQISGTVSVTDVVKKWLLQPNDEILYDGYGWIDEDMNIWEDGNVWREKTRQFLPNHWFKLTLLPPDIDDLSKPPIQVKTYNLSQISEAIKGGNSNAII